MTEPQPGAAPLSETDAPAGTVAGAGILPQAGAPPAVSVLPEAGVPPAVSVIIVNYNAGDDLARCLRALAAQRFAAFEALVLDNGSRDGSFERARAAVADPRFRFKAAGANLGFAAANNLLAREARAPLLVTLNPDAFAEPDWLARLVAAAQAHPDVAMLGSTQLDDADPGRFDGIGDAYFAPGLPWRGGYGRPRHGLPPAFESFAPCAAAALYRRDGFLALGGFDERFFCYCEDVDLGFRWRLAGGRALQITDAVVRHAGGSSAAAAPSGFADYHGMRNLIWMFAKDMPAPLLWPLLPLHAALVALLLLRALLLGRPGPVWRGFRDALAGLPETWRARRAVQAARRAPAAAIARALNWSPLRLLSRRPVGT